MRNSPLLPTDTTLTKVDARNDERPPHQVESPYTIEFPLPVLSAVATTTTTTTTTTGAFPFVLDDNGSGPPPPPPTAAVASEVRKRMDHHQGDHPERRRVDVVTYQRGNEATPTATSQKHDTQNSKRGDMLSPEAACAGNQVAPAEQTAVGPMFGPNRARREQPQSGGGDDKKESGDWDESQLDFSRCRWLITCFLQDTVEAEFRVYFYARRVMPIAFSVFAAVLSLAAAIMFSTSSMVPLTRALNLVAAGLWGALAVVFWSSDVMMGGGGSVWYRRWLRGVVKWVHGGSNRGQETQPASQGLQQIAATSGEEREAVEESAEESTTTPREGQNDVAAQVEEGRRRRRRISVENHNKNSSFSSSRTSPTSSSHNEGRDDDTKGKRDEEEEEEDEAADAFILSPDSTARRRIRFEAKLHELFRILLHCVSFLLGLGNILENCNDPSVADSMVMCSHTIQGDALLLLPIVSASFLAPVRTVISVPLYGVGLLVYFGLTVIPGVPYGPSDAQFYSDIILITTEVAVCVAMCVFREERMRLNFTLHVRRRLRGRIVDRIRQQAERIASLQLPVELLRLRGDEDEKSKAAIGDEHAAGGGEGGISSSSTSASRLVKREGGCEGGRGGRGPGRAGGGGGRVVMAPSGMYCICFDQPQRKAIVISVATRNFGAWCATRAPSDIVDVLHHLTEVLDEATVAAKRSLAGRKGGSLELPILQRVHMMGDAYVMIAAPPPPPSSSSSSGFAAGGGGGGSNTSAVLTSGGMVKQRGDVSLTTAAAAAAASNSGTIAAADPVVVVMNGLSADVRFRCSCVALAMTLFQSLSINLLDTIEDLYWSDQDTQQRAQLLPLGSVVEGTAGYSLHRSTHNIIGLGPAVDRTLSFLLQSGPAEDLETARGCNGTVYCSLAKSREVLRHLLEDGSSPRETTALSQAQMPQHQQQRQALLPLRSAAPAATKREEPKKSSFSSVPELQQAAAGGELLSPSSLVQLVQESSETTAAAAGATTGGSSSTDASNTTMNVSLSALAIVSSRLGLVDAKIQPQQSHSRPPRNPLMFSSGRGSGGGEAERLSDDGVQRNASVMFVLANAPVVDEDDHEQLRQEQQPQQHQRASLLLSTTTAWERGPEKSATRESKSNTSTTNASSGSGGGGGGSYDNAITSAVQHRPVVEVLAPAAPVISRGKEEEADETTGKKSKTTAAARIKHESDANAANDSSSSSWWHQSDANNRGGGTGDDGASQTTTVDDGTERTATEYMFRIWPRFKDSRTEKDYHTYVVSFGYNLLDTCMSVGCSGASLAALLGICFVIGDENDFNDFPIWRQPVVWSAAGLGVCVLLLVSCVVVIIRFPESRRAAPRGPLRVFHLLVLFFAQLSYMLPIFVSHPDTLVHNTQIVWIIVMLSWSIHRPLHQSFLVMWLHDAVVSTFFLLRALLWVAGDLNMLAVFLAVAMFVGIPIVRLLRERSRREAFAVEKILDYLQQDIEADYMKLTKGLENMVPSGIAGELVRTARRRLEQRQLQELHAAGRGTGRGDEGGGPPPEHLNEFRIATSDVFTPRPNNNNNRRRKLRHPLYSTSQNLGTEDMLFAAVRLRVVGRKRTLAEERSNISSSSSSGGDGVDDASWNESLTMLSLLDRIDDYVPEAVRCRVVTVQCTHDTALLVALPRLDSARDDYDEERARDLRTASRQVFAELYKRGATCFTATGGGGGGRSRSLVPTMILDVGPAMGAVMGRSAVHFTYCSGAISRALAILTFVDPGNAVMSTRVELLLRLSSPTGFRSLLPEFTQTVCDGEDSLQQQQQQQNLKRVTEGVDGGNMIDSFTATEVGSSYVGKLRAVGFTPQSVIVVHAH